MLKTPTNWLAQHERLKVVLIGCGGTGSVLAENLCRLNQALIGLGGKGIELTMLDDDTVEPHNLGRQRYSYRDIGKHKAIQLAERLNREHGWDSRALVRRVNEANVERTLDWCSILITAVDNWKTREMIHDALRNFRKGSLEAHRWWIDTGNGASFGQVVLGSSRTKTIIDLHKPPGPEEEVISCSMHQSLLMQELFINTHIAGIASELLWRAFRHGYLEYNAIYFNARKMEMAHAFYKH